MATAGDRLHVDSRRCGILSSRTSEHLLTTRSEIGDELCLKHVAGASGDRHAATSYSHRLRAGKRAAPSGHDADVMRRITESVFAPTSGHTGHLEAVAEPRIPLLVQTHLFGPPDVPFCAWAKSVPLRATSKSKCPAKRPNAPLIAAGGDAIAGRRREDR